MSAVECLRLAVGGIFTLSALLREALLSQVAEHQSAEVRESERRGVEAATLDRGAPRTTTVRGRRLLSLPLPEPSKHEAQTRRLSQK